MDAESVHLERLGAFVEPRHHVPQKVGALAVINPVFAPQSHPMRAARFCAALDIKVAGMIRDRDAGQRQNLSKFGVGFQACKRFCSCCAVAGLA